MWLAQLVRLHRMRDPDGLALRDRWRDVTWRGLERDVIGLAGTLAARVPPGGRVLVLSANRVEVLESYVAAGVAGVVAVPVHPGSNDAELAAIAAATRPCLALADAAGRARLGIRLPDLTKLSIEDVIKLPALGWPDRGGDLCAPVAILHTSGTTGCPKGVLLDQRGLQRGALSWLADVGVPPGTRFLNSCPLSHCSMVIALNYLAAGATVGVLDRFTPTGCLAALAQWKIGHAFLVPSTVRLLLESPALAETDLSALALMLHGAAPLPAELALAARARLGVALQTVFGITEGCGPVLTLRPQDSPGDPPVPGAICAGLPMLGIEARVLDRHGAPAGIEEVGEIHLRGDGLMRGYWEESAATAEVLRGGWLNTNDLGCFGQDGYLWVVDRLGDLIQRGGQNVYPAEVEHVLRACPQVADVAVVPAPSQAWGQTPVAFVQPAPGATVIEDALIELCLTRLSGYKRPSRFVMVDQIPRNPAGKLLRARLRGWAAEATR